MQGVFTESIPVKAMSGIIDFVDTAYPVLLRMWDKRQRGYKAMGYRIIADGDESVI